MSQIILIICLHNFIINNKNKILIFLILISAISFIATIKKGFFNGCDFQWQPATLFWEGINHYNKFLTNGKYDFLFVKNSRFPNIKL